MSEGPKDLAEYLGRHPAAAGFTPGAHYCARGDFVIYYARDEPCIAVRVDDCLTVFLSMDDRRELVGCKFDGAREVAREAVKYVGQGRPLLLIAFVLAGLECQLGASQMRWYSDVAMMFRGVGIDAAAFGAM